MIFDSIKIKNNIPVKYNEIELDYSDAKVIIIYGDNGVGKTELSRAFISSQNCFDDFRQVEFLDSNEVVVELPNNYEVFVYNEDFITNKIFFGNDENLDAILINDSIQDIEEEIQNEEENQLRIQNDLLKEDDYFEEVENDYSEKKENLLKKLKGDNSWASRDKNINNPANKHNTSVNLNTLSNFEKFLSLSENEYKSIKEEQDISIEEFSAEKIDELKQKSEEYQKSLEKAGNKHKLDKASFNYDINETQFINIKELLLRKIEKKEIQESADELSRKINTIYENNGRNSIENSLNILETQLNANNEFCPTCFQNISENYLNDLKSKVTDLISEEFQNKTIKDFINNIDQAKLSTIGIGTFNYKEEALIYFEDEINQIKNIIEELNQEITRVNGLLEDKKNNLYSSMHDSNNRIEDLLKLISEKIIILNNLFSEHDQEIDDIDVTKTIATENNNELTFYIHYNEFQEYFSKEKEYNELINERNPDNLNSTYNQLKKDLNKSSSDLETLKNKLGQINLAVDIINNKLDWITTNKNSIKIVPENEKYYVYVNNQKAKLSNLSTGQRNMISLCYFFTQINEGKEISELYSENGIFLVLDDPISSLDYSNRTGMMSLLRYEIGKILLSSENSRVLITSHDTSVIYDLEKIIQDINTERSISSSPVRNIKFETKQLLNISDTPIKSFDASKDYVRLFTNIFQFADGLYDNNENSIADLSIGNNIRKVLEAYSTFNLNKGIRYLSLEEKVLDKLPSDELKNYYKYDMIKFLLDVESHQEKRIQTFSGIYGLPNYPYSDKKKIAQDVIYFLYAIDELHVSYNIKNFNSETKRKIESWNPINRVD